jgi:[ribosomal protein S5]-alanine N-acetyltransferase
MIRAQSKLIKLRTKRFALRTLRQDDASESWLAWLQDPEVMDPLNLPARKMTLADIRSYIASFNNDSRSLVGIFERAGKTLIGFFMIEVDHIHRLVTFNVLIGDKAWWGKGVVNEARAALLDHVFKEWKMEKACGAPFARNFAAILNYKAQGWRHEGTLRSHRVSLIDGTRTDQFQFGLLRSEWRKVRAKGR